MKDDHVIFSHMLAFLSFFALAGLLDCLLFFWLVNIGMDILLAQSLAVACGILLLFVLRRMPHINHDIAFSTAEYNRFIITNAWVIVITLITVYIFNQTLGIPLFPIKIVNILIALGCNCFYHVRALQRAERNGTRL
nr:GtrA family protein [Maliibacterium massiliense]